MCPYSTTVDGFEMQFGTNHLGHFLLTNLLLPGLAAFVVRDVISTVLRNSKARVVNLSSTGHKMAPKGGIDFEHLNPGASAYNSFTVSLLVFLVFLCFQAYGQSKLANILFTKELNRRFRGEIASFAVHPGSSDASNKESNNSQGVVRTDLTRHFNRFLQFFFDLAG